MSKEPQQPVLEPEEIAALMEKLAPDEQAQAFLASLPPLPQPEHVADFSFESDRPDGPERYPLYAVIQQHLAESLREHFNDIFHRQITLDNENMELQVYGQLISSEDSRVYLVFECAGFGLMLVIIDTQLVVSYVDAMLGGTGEKSENSENMEQLSPVEERLSERLANALKHMFEASWKPVEAIEFRLVNVETDVEFLGVASDKEECFKTIFKAKFSSDVNGYLNICYPRTFLEPLLGKLRANAQETPTSLDEEWNKELRNCLQEAPLELRLELGSVSMNVRDFLSLKTGDHLPIFKRETDTVTLWVESEPMFEAMAGQNDGVLAAEIIQTRLNGGKR